MTAIPSASAATSAIAAGRAGGNAGIVRASGLFAILAGLIFAGIQPIHPPDMVGALGTTAWTVVIALKFVACLSFLVATAGLYACHAGRTGFLGLAAFATFALSWWLQAGFVFTELFVLPSLATVSPEFAESFLGIFNGHPGPLALAPLAAAYNGVGLLYLVGGVLTGIVLFRSALVPRLPSALLAASALLTPLAALLPHEMQRFAAVPVGVAFIWLGLALWRRP